MRTAPTPSRRSLRRAGSTARRSSAGPPTSSSRRTARSSSPTTRPARSTGSATPGCDGAVLIDRGVPAGAAKARAGAPKPFRVARAVRRPRTVLDRAVLAALAVAASGVVAAQAQDPSPAFQEKLETCFACHGPGGVSQTPEVPSLAGQPDLFMQWQLVYMRDETRKVEPMMEVVKDMTDAEIRGFGKLFAALPPPPRAEGPDPDP